MWFVQKVSGLEL